ncbi:conserved hypothetical protein [Shewanella sediminis HAW-EB3]|uniref:Uncharacterized protein n=1 Tax=Shewanella sediminis (strain HAW-EB3) TaxID=425104 RepID=A8G0R5_SHESH|nr:hypothetical protein [Shewanella sediminis]ABV38688.1 conserved hypothetical protein [Shewanella sediminis HAW-EB3]
MRYQFRLFTHKIAIALIAVVLLQFAGANLGAHQLHLGSHDEESENHPHLQFTAEITSLAQCVDCTCSAEAELDSESFASNKSFASESANDASGHSHIVSKTETKTFDLCLDCQCHGGHVTAMSINSTTPLAPVDDALTSIGSHYLPPEALPDYRPPIA